MNGLPVQMRVPRSAPARLLASLGLLILIGTALVSCDRGLPGVNHEQPSSSVHIAAVSGGALVVHSEAGAATFKTIRAWPVQSIFNR